MTIYSDTHDDGMRHAIDIIEGMYSAMAPLEVKFPGQYDRRLSLLRVAINCVTEQIGYLSNEDDDANSHSDVSGTGSG